MVCGHHNRVMKLIHLHDDEVGFRGRALRSIDHNALEQVLAVQLAQQLARLGVKHIENPKIDELIAHIADRG